jgi:hypothetical protein
MLGFGNTDEQKSIPNFIEYNYLNSNKIKEHEPSHDNNIEAYSLPGDIGKNDYYTLVTGICDKPSWRATSDQKK